ncbi:MAG TPA: MCP four helix bundle domain-containing protein, partial [Hyphomonadaceae bacterium]|nr:MCP four helix bundle domain-containing protein [Hyphomonadaceae bacterium]
MSISSRLFIGFGIVIILMMGLGLYGISQVSLVRDNMERVVERDFAMISELNAIYEGQAEATAATQDAVRLGMGGNPPIAEIDKAEATYRESITRMRDAVRRAIALTDEFSGTALSAER